MSRMFSFIKETWNPLGGECPHKCIYCWSRHLAGRYGMKKYQGEPRLIKSELKRKFKPGSFVFTQDMTDLFADNVPIRLILKVLDVEREHPKVKFLHLTKNTKRYIDLAEEKEFPPNVVLGATVETDFYRFFDLRKGEDVFIEYEEISRAPPPQERLRHLRKLKEIVDNPLFISIEPILDFSTDIHLPPRFVERIKMVKPWAVAVGYDNYNHKLPEPPLNKTLRLIEELEKFTKVYKKTLRRAWYE